MRYRLRTLLILLAILPPLLALGWWKYSAWRAEQARLKALAVERQQAIAASRQQALQALAIRVQTLFIPVPANPPAFRQPPGNRDYQFPPQPPIRISDEEPNAAGRNRFTP